MQIPNKQQVQALSEDLRSRSKIPGAKFIASQIFLLSWWIYLPRYSQSSVGWRFSAVFEYAGASTQDYLSGCLQTIHLIVACASDPTT